MNIHVRTTGDPRMKPVEESLAKMDRGEKSRWIRNAMLAYHASAGNSKLFKKLDEILDAVKAIDAKPLVVDKLATKKKMRKISEAE